jgi:hypothetical protein
MASRSGAGSGGGVFAASRGGGGGGGRDEVPLSGVRSSEKADDAFETFDASASDDAASPRVASRRRGGRCARGTRTRGEAARARARAETRTRTRTRAAASGHRAGHDAHAVAE